MDNILYISTFSVSELETALKRVLVEFHENKGQQQPTPNGAELITRQETAEILRITLPTLNNWTKNGLLKSYKLASRVRYRRDEVMRIFENGNLKKYGRQSQ